MVVLASCCFVYRERKIQCTPSSSIALDPCPLSPQHRHRNSSHITVCTTAHLSFACADNDINGVCLMKLKLTALVLPPVSSSQPISTASCLEQDKQAMLVSPLLIRRIEYDCLLPFVAVSLKLVAQNTLDCITLK